MFKIRMGIPEMKEFWERLIEKRRDGKLNFNEKELYKKLRKAVRFLSNNPRHPGLQSHEIEILSKKCGFKVWQSYLDQGEKARRFFWAYGPNQKEITIISIEPHPEDKKRGAYKRIKLSNLPPV